MVEGVLGRGGMATVYSARHGRARAPVALKVLAGELGTRSRVRRTLPARGPAAGVARAPARRHGLRGGRVRARPLPRDAARVGVDARDADARARARRATRAGAPARRSPRRSTRRTPRGLVHRDVKPQNVLVGDSDDAYLGDFGLTTLGGAERRDGHRQARRDDLLPRPRGHPRRRRPARPRTATRSPRWPSSASPARWSSRAAPRPRSSSRTPASRRRGSAGGGPSSRRALDDVFARALSKDPGERPDSATALVDSSPETLAGRAARRSAPPPPPGAAALEEHDGRAASAELRRPAPQRPLRRRRWRWLAGAALAGRPWRSASARSIGDGDEREAGGCAGAAAGRAGARQRPRPSPGSTLDCRGRAAEPRSPGCTIVQAALPGPAAGRARGRRDPALGRALGPRRAGARGRCARGTTETFQVARSRNEFVSDGGVHVFDTDLAVERGDLVGARGPCRARRSAPARGVDGATTTRWIPSSTAGRTAVDRGFDDTSCSCAWSTCRGGQQRLPRQVTGAAAAELKPGRVVKRRRLRFTNGRPVEMASSRWATASRSTSSCDGRRTRPYRRAPDFRPGEAGSSPSRCTPLPGSETLGDRASSTPRTTARGILTTSTPRSRVSSSSSTELAVAGFRFGAASSAAGARAIVYEATQVSLDRRVALKLLAEDDERPDRSSGPSTRTSSACTRPDSSEQGPFVAMQLVRGPEPRRAARDGRGRPGTRGGAPGRRRLGARRRPPGGDRAWRGRRPQRARRRRRPRAALGLRPLGRRADRGSGQGRLRGARAGLPGRPPAAAPRPALARGGRRRPARARDAAATPAASKPTPPQLAAGIGVVAAAVLASVLLDTLGRGRRPGAPPPRERRAGARQRARAGRRRAPSTATAGRRAGPPRPAPWSRRACPAARWFRPPRAPFARWVVRGARGEIALQVSAPAAGGYVSVARTRRRRVPDDGRARAAGEPGRARGRPRRRPAGARLRDRGAAGRAGRDDRALARPALRRAAPGRARSEGAASITSSCCGSEYTRGARPTPAGVLSGRSAPSGRPPDASSPRATVEVRGRVRRVAVVRLADTDRDRPLRRRAGGSPATRRPTRIRRAGC